MAEPFNKLDVQHEWEEITVQTRCSPCNGPATTRVRTRPISTQPLLALYKSTRTARVQKTGKRYITYTRCNSPATARHEYKTGKTYITRANSQRTERVPYKSHKKQYRTNRSLRPYKRLCLFACNNTNNNR